MKEVIKELNELIDFYKDLKKKYPTCADLLDKVIKVYEKGKQELINK